MDISKVKITQKDIDLILAKAVPAQPAGIVGDACSVYSTARPLLETAIAILRCVYPPASTALATVLAIMDKVCAP